MEMNEDPPRNNLAWRVSVLEREVDELKKGKPDVIAERVRSLSGRVDDLKREVNDDIGDLREDVKSLRRILLGFFSGFALALAAAVLTILLAQ